MEFLKTANTNDKEQGNSIPERHSNPAPSPKTIKKVKRTSQKNPKWFMIGALIAILIIVPFFIYLANDSNQNNSGQPQFESLLPRDKSIEQLGGWVKTNQPDSDESIFSYNDELADTSILVSEQAMPDNFYTDQDSSLRELAKSFNATASFKAGDTTVYSGQSSNGPEYAIFIKQNVLIFIKSESTISTKDWITYISSLN